MSEDSLFIPTFDCETNNAFLPYWPILTVLSEKASTIGRPATVLTLNNEPESESSIENNRPAVPSTVNTLDPEAFIDKDPEIVDDPVILAPPWSTINPFLILNSFGISIYCVHIPTVINKYIELCYWTVYVHAGVDIIEDNSS